MNMKAQSLRNVSQRAPSAVRWKDFLAAMLTSIVVVEPFAYWLGPSGVGWKWALVGAFVQVMYHTWIRSSLLSSLTSAITLGLTFAVVSCLFGEIDFGLLIFVGYFLAGLTGTFAAAVTSARTADLRVQIWFSVARMARI